MPTRKTEDTNDEITPEVTPEQEPVEEPVIVEVPVRSGDLKTAAGVLEMMSDGYGFLRANGLTPGPGDIYISQSQIKRFDLRPGDMVEGKVRPPKEAERYLGMLEVTEVNKVDPAKLGHRPRFERLIAVYPDRPMKLETGKTPISTRIVDLIS